MISYLLILTVTFTMYFMSVLIKKNSKMIIFARLKDGQTTSNLIIKPM